MRRMSAAVLAAVAWGGAAHGAPTPSGACKIGLIGELAVEPGLRPRLKGEVEGRPIDILADTGAFNTILMEGPARNAGLALDQAKGFVSYGVGGKTRLYTTIIPHMKIAGVRADGLVALVASGSPHGVDMLLGADFWSQADVEFDLAHGKIRMLNTKGCADDQMTYWATGPFSIAPLNSESEKLRYLTEVRINGRLARALIDSGAEGSVLTQTSARRLGLVTKASQVTFRGLGEQTLPGSIAQLDTFQVGDETIKGTQIAVAELHKGVVFNDTGSRIGEGPDAPDLVLGADFLKAHRVILSRARNKMYFTYSGGPVLRPPPESGPDDGKANAKPAPEVAGKD